jgi:hypothetical protein
VTWEGDQAIEECTDDETILLARRKDALKARKRTQQTKFVVESEESESSEDEYVEEKEERLGKRKTAEKVCFSLHELLVLSLNSFVASHTSPTAFYGVGYRFGR